MTGVLYRFCATIAAMPIAAWLLPGVHATSRQAAWIAGVILGLIYLLLRPLAKLLTSPLNCLTFGLMGMAVDIGFIYLTMDWIPGFTMDGFPWVLATALLVALLREGLGKVLGVSQ